MTLRDIQKFVPTENDLRLYVRTGDPTHVDGARAAFDQLIELAALALDMGDYLRGWIELFDETDLGHETVAALLARLDQLGTGGCAACHGDPKAHGLHVCGKEPYA